MFKNLLVLLAACMAVNGAEFRLPPLPPEPVKASQEEVQAAIRTLVVLDVSTTLLTHTNYAEPLAYHFRAIADVFRDMPLDGTFSTEHLNGKLEKILPPIETDVSSVRTALAAVYGRVYAHRGRASTPPLEFLAGISKTFNEAIREGIRKGGKSAVVEESQAIPRR
jgi:hypothetical protein